MYLGKTDGLRTAPQGQRYAGQKSEKNEDQTAADIQRIRDIEVGCRIGLVISDDCSSSDVAQALASTCERFGDPLGRPDGIGKISITIIAGRSGFVLRENACLPVWCEAICDVDPLDFQYFVVAKSGNGTPEPRPEIVSWLARAGAEAKIIRLAVGAKGESHALALPERAEASSESSVPDGGELLRLERYRAWRDESSRATAAHVIEAPVNEPADLPAPSERIKATVEWINENYGGRVSIACMAERALMSERNFLRRFRAEMGHTPHEYLSKIRLESARKLLLSTALPVDKIARHCGLFNGDHLRKHFVKHFGMSPVEYRTARFKALQSQGETGMDES